jgi:hypothetical protein
MPRLTFFQLTKVFAAGFLGYALLISALSCGTALLFPSFIKTGWFDMSIHEFFKTIFYFFWNPGRDCDATHVDRGLVHIALVQTGS